MKKVFFLILTFILLSILLFVAYRVFFLSSNAKGALQVTSSPESTVYLNDKLIGKTPLCVCGSEIEITEEVASNVENAFGSDAREARLIPVGEYTVRLVPDDESFSEFQEKITIGQTLMSVVDRTFGEGAESEGIVFTLEKTNNAQSAELLVLSVPGDANIYLNSESIGSSPVSRTDVTESVHELTLRKNGYKEKTVQIKTENGYKLIAKVYLGVDEQVVTGRQSEEEDEAASEDTETSGLDVSRVRILFTGTGFLRVREGPSLADPEIGRVTPQEEYPLASEEGEWYQIEYEEGELGWISKQYAELVQEEEEVQEEE